MSGPSTYSTASSVRSSSSSYATSICGLTAIELERLENIKANQAVLASVGLGGTRRPGGTFHEDNDEGERTQKKKQKKQKPPSRPTTEPSRRSSRNLGRDAPDYREDPIALSNPPSSSFTSSRHTWKSSNNDGKGEGLGAGEEWDSTTMAEAAAAAASRVSATPGSSRLRDADVQSMLREYLGKKVPHTGKQCVMDLLTPNAGTEGGESEGGREGGPVKFSKYAGVVEWRNCMVLWVNVDGNDYENLWLEGGRKLTWFAGSRVKPETPVMVRLLAAGSAGGRKDGSEGENGEKEKGKERGKGGEESWTEVQKEDKERQEDVLLFCRSQGGPYVCMGRVWHVWFDTRTHPIKVLWILRDWEEIWRKKDVMEVIGIGREKKEEEEEEEYSEGKGKKKA
ncbi:hypothetical protein VYU27_006822 [Nannochloropsis oceanica]